MTACDMSLTRASRFLRRDHKTVRRACTTLHIPLCRDHRNQFVLSADDVREIALYLEELAGLHGPRGAMLRGECEDGELPRPEMEDRVTAARRWKDRSGGRFLTQERLDVELAAMRQEVAG